jgi:hypothetical protein
MSRNRADVVRQDSQAKVGRCIVGKRGGVGLVTTAS